MPPFNVEQRHETGIETSIDVTSDRDRDHWAETKDIYYFLLQTKSVLW